MSALASVADFQIDDASKESTKEFLKNHGTSGEMRVVFVPDDASDDLDNKENVGQRLPKDLEQAILGVLRHIADGRSVAVIPKDAELTTQQAAEILNVSRPYLIKVLESGDLPYHKVGTHRRVRYRDLLDYKNRIYAERTRALDEMVALSQKMGEYD